jgi:hypothetical protein
MQEEQPTEIRLPIAALPLSQGPSWQDLSHDEQNMLVHRLIHPESEETPHKYGEDLNEMHTLLVWASTEERLFLFERFGDACHRRMLNRLNRPAEYGTVIPLESGLFALNAGDVCYALLETYGQLCPDLEVPRYGDVWRKTIEH